MFLGVGLAMALLVTISEARGQSASGFEKVPDSFYFDYQFEPTPGKRYWLRVDTRKWIERYPDGRLTKFSILGRAKVDDTTGIVVQKTDEKTFQVFIPDKRSKLM
jgi:hypothetical protein